MKKLMIAMMVFGASSAAYADGFVCQTLDGDLTIKAYNHVTPENGTRNAAVMVLSDPSVSAGRKTIARFTDTNETLINSGARYVADVDLRFNDSGRKGELIAGTKLGQLKTIELFVNFSYLFPIENGASTSGLLVLEKRDGTTIEKQLECTRYLKN